MGEGQQRSQAADLQRLRTLAVKFMLYNLSVYPLRGAPAARDAAHRAEAASSSSVPGHIWASAPALAADKFLSAIAGLPPALPEGPGNTWQSALRCSTGESCRGGWSCFDTGFFLKGALTEPW